MASNTEGNRWVEALVKQSLPLKNEAKRKFSTDSIIDCISILKSNENLDWTLHFKFSIVMKHSNVF